MCSARFLVMKYDTYPPQPDLEAIVKCYWTLEVPAGLDAPKQRVVPDGCIEMCFILGDDIKRFTSETDYLLQPRAMVIGQITKPYFIQPTGYVNSFAVRFYPYGFANFINKSFHELADKETPLEELFEPELVRKLAQEIIAAPSTAHRIRLVEQFLLAKLAEPVTLDTIVKSTIDALVRSNGNTSIRAILQEDPSKRRSLERNFSKQVGISPKHLGRIIRLQAALKMMLSQQDQKLTQVAYDNAYYDQAHFIKDFQEFTGTSPSEYLSDDQMLLSSLLYSKD